MPTTPPTEPIEGTAPKYCASSTPPFCGSVKGRPAASRRLNHHYGFIAGVCVIYILSFAACKEKLAAEGIPLRLQVVFGDACGLDRRHRRIPPGRIEFHHDDRHAGYLFQQAEHTGEI